jgi:hypothetical protein
MTIRKVICMKKSKWSAKYLRVVSLFLLIGALSNRLWAAPGDLDLSFNFLSEFQTFAVIAPTPVLQADVRRELAEVDPNGRFGGLLANKP